MWKSYSISFAIIVLIMGFLIGAVLGSLLSQIFGMAFLNKDLFQAGFTDFYAVKSLQISPTPAALLGFLTAAWVLYKRSRQIHEK